MANIASRSSPVGIPIVTGTGSAWTLNPSVTTRSEAVMHFMILCNRILPSIAIIIFISSKFIYSQLPVLIAVFVMSRVQVVDSAGFQAAIQGAGDQLVVIDFFATW